MDDERFADANQALNAARGEMARIRSEGDSMFAVWSEASPGRPEIVRDVFGHPSYWLVPVVLSDKTIGFIRVLGDTGVAAYGAFYRDPSHLESCPPVVTGITAEEAGRLAAGHIRADRGESASEPVFVHDGPPGREAWLIEVSVAGRPSRWVFATPGFTYERAAGEVRDDNLE